MICQHEGCNNEIPALRLQLQPRTVTCSPACTKERDRAQRRAASARAHRRSGYKAARKSYRKRKGK